MKKYIIKNNNGQYLPLFNLKGLKASITPFFAGSLCLDHHHYALTPPSDLTLYQLDNSRNVIFTVNNQRYFLNGNTIEQQNDSVDLYIDKLYQKVVRKNDLFSLDTTSFIPINETVELHKTIIKNTSDTILDIDVITATPIYGRSADNLRDHRHVTSLLNRVSIEDETIFLQPTLSFDERGHLKNETIYSFSATLEDVNINRYIPNIHEFLSGGTMAFPKGIHKTNTKVLDGYEVMGAIGFEKFKLNPGEEKSLIFAIGIHNSKKVAKTEIKRTTLLKNFDDLLKQNISFFDKLLSPLSFMLSSVELSNELSWVCLQPILRRYLGNSYLPHHDYGHGGRGWRDLWQDLLSLIMYNDNTVKDLLISNFQGIRIDGSNATIIGDKAGEFKADRNQIVRVWSDHGTWPLLTIKMYIDETADLNILKIEQPYFDDKFTHFTKRIKSEVPSDNKLRVNNKVYQGTIFEHLLVQNLISHMNVGENGFIRLEDADWNDGLDMAKENGESIPFTAFYASNLKVLSEFASKLNEPLKINSDIFNLLKGEISLNQYFDSVASFNATTITVDNKVIAKLLSDLADERISYFISNAWIIDSHYHSYINNDKKLLDDKNSISLTAQAIPLLSKIVPLHHAIAISHKTNQLLFDPQIGGYKLNTNYDSLMLNMGRAYGFAYGHKENGAVFSHMVMMYAYGLYEYNLVDYANQAYKTILNQSMDNSSNLLSGIPEYFTPNGVGMYPYLTGSASWLLKLIRTQVFGINLEYGTLTLNPKLKLDDFINNKATINTYLFGSLRKITYINEKGLDYGQYKIAKILSGSQELENSFTNLKHDLEVILDEI